ncbi:MAG: hypothetical protein LBT79_00820 [Elusimicrobiota bacterium]|jgi:hypothetical protein|nr:hypothetical protein [Elusimicrobiota bacterium]
MAKRFTDTGKFRDAWYRKLNPIQKCIWEYALSECNHAGILNLDLEAMSFHIGAEIKKDDLKVFGDRFVFLKNETIFIPKFIGYQYGELNEAVNAHKGVIELLNKYNINPFNPLATLKEQLSNSSITENEPLPNSCQRVMDKDKDKDINNTNTKRQIDKKESTKTDKVEVVNNNNKQFDKILADSPFKDITNKFMNFRKDIKKPFKSIETLKSFLKLLHNLSNGDTNKAAEIIEISIANGWQGIFELKNKSSPPRPVKDDLTKDYEFKKF